VHSVDLFSGLIK